MHRLGRPADFDPMRDVSDTDLLAEYCEYENTVTSRLITSLPTVLASVPPAGASGTFGTLTGGLCDVNRGRCYLRNYKRLVLCALKGRVLSDSKLWVGDP